MHFMPLKVTHNDLAKIYSNKSSNSKADAQLLGFTLIAWIYTKIKHVKMINTLLLQSVSLKMKQEKKPSGEKKPRE